MIDWESLKKDLNGSTSDSAVTTIVNNWEGRPRDFFRGVEKRSWQRVIPYLLNSQIRAIYPEEFAFMTPKVLEKTLANLKVCPTVDISFWTVERIRHISTECLYTILTQVKAPVTLGKLWERISWSVIFEFTDEMKSSWLNIDHGDFKSMDPSVLGIISSDLRVCSVLGVAFWTEGTIKGISKECLYKILTQVKVPVKLGKLWQKVPWWTMDSFTDEMRISWLNIDRSDFILMDRDVLRVVSSDLRICHALGLSFWTDETIRGISSKCLHEIITKTKVPVKLGSLWGHIDQMVITRFTDEMKSSWLNIDHGDFELMSLDVLNIISSELKVCSALGAKFWTKETIKGISKECLHMLLTKEKAPVKLGELWQQINWQVMVKFTDVMKSSWLNIDHGDFDLMGEEILKVISSGPKVCSTLGATFWMRGKIKNISGHCLYELFRKDETPLALGVMWNEISPGSIHSFLEKMEFSWDFIHPNDHTFFTARILDTIKQCPRICGALNVSFWSNETIKYVTENCLYEILSGKGPIVLGRLWDHIPDSTIKDFKVWKLNLLGKVIGADFQFMPLDFLKFIFSSEKAVDQLPRPLTEIILSSRAREVELSPQQFATLVRSAPSIAGQLLWYSTKLSGDLLSECNGDGIRRLKLSIPGVAELDWKNLFLKLEEKYYFEERASSFSQMIFSISDSAKIHFCETLTDIDEYMLLPWLGRNLGDICRSKLPFKVSSIFQLLLAPELSPQDLSWREMLNFYNHNQWTEFSSRQSVAAFLGNEYEFWSTIISNYPEILRVLHKNALNRINPNFILSLGNALCANVERIPFLPKDAFSEHRINQLPCRLQDLSPAQISQLSIRTIKNLSKPTSEEILQHVLSGVTLSDVQALNLEQSKFLCDYQWTFIPGHIKSEMLSLRIKKVHFQLSSTLPKSIVNEDCHFNTAALKNHIKAAVNVLELAVEIYKDDHQGILDSALLLFINFIRASNLQKTFVEIFQGSTLLSPASIALVRNVEELWDYNRKVFNKMGFGQAEISLEHDHWVGFDRSSVIDILYKKSELFAAPKVRIISQGIRGIQGPIRALISQILSDIERDLVVPYTGIDQSKENCQVDGMDVDDDREAGFRHSLDINMMDIENTIDKSGNAKFGWGISRETGFIVGLIFGKALQLDIRLPFVLGSAFYRLLVGNGDGGVEKYYKSAYSQEISKFEQGVENLFDAGNLAELLQILPRPERLRFTRLSAKADEEARKDTMTKTNVWGCTGKDDCYDDDDENLHGQNFAKDYIKNVLTKVMGEFKGFIRELIRGLGVAFPPIRELKELSVPFLYPFVEFLPSLLDAEPIKADGLIKKIVIEQSSAENLVLFEKRKVTALDVLFAFIRSLDERQLEHLVGVWAGSSTLSLKNAEARVIFFTPNQHTPSTRIKFCDFNDLMGAKSGGPLPIAPAKEYMLLFEKFAKILLGEDKVVEPECPDEGIDFNLIRVSICAKWLTIYLQSVQQMFNSLFDLLTTPLTAIRDN